MSVASISINVPVVTNVAAMTPTASNVVGPNAGELVAQASGQAAKAVTLETSKVQTLSKNSNDLEYGRNAMSDEEEYPSTLRDFETSRQARIEAGESREKEQARKEAFQEAERAAKGGIDSAQIKTIGLIVEQYSGKDLSASDWSKLYQELEAQGFDISKPLIDVLL